MSTVIPFIPTEEELAEIEEIRRRHPRPPSAQPPPPEPGPQPTPTHTDNWRRHLRPVNAPPPAWYKPEPPPPPAESRAEAEEDDWPEDAPGGGETSATSAFSTGRSTSMAVPKGEETAPTATHSSGGSIPAEPAGEETSTLSTGGSAREHPIPEDSILADYRDFVRSISEMPDGPIIAPILSLCGRLLTPDVVLDFGARKPLTIYNFVTSPSGLRKSTTFGPAEKIARQILMSDDMIYGNASDSALFDTFEEQPHRLQFEDEGHTLLRTWETSAYGREVSARYLKLYDGTPWTQNFLRERKLHEGGAAERTIPQATLSLCIASTFGVAQLSQLDAGSGLRRRFGFYMATQKARRLLWPESLEDPELERLGELFRDLTHLKGTIGRRSFTPAAWQYWAALQARNHERTQSIPGYTSGEENLLSSLNESPARCLKLAIIFQACRWARDNRVDPYTLTPDVLELAEAHQNACLDALVELETTGRRWEMEDTAEWLLAQISGDHPALKSATYSRNDLTRRFASTPGRRGALTTSRLYGEIIPKLIEQGHCVAHPKKGKLQTYTFHWD